MSASQITSTAGGGLSGSGLGSVTGALQGSITQLTNLGSEYLNHFFPPEKRQQWIEWLTKFATEKPYLASFLLSQIALSAGPLILFGVMSVTVLIFALIAGVLVGVIGALLFVVAMLGVALLVLLPTLFFTTSAAVFIWLWGVGAYFIVKWFNQKEIPGIHTDLKGGLAQATGFNDLPGVNGNSLGSEGADSAGNGSAKKEKKEDVSSKSDGKVQKHDHGKVEPKDQKHEKATTTGAQHQGTGEESQSHPRKLNKTSTDGTPKKVNGAIDGAGKEVKGVAGNTTKGVGT